MKERRLFLISLGCPRNLVDSEFVLGKLKQRGFFNCDEPKDIDLAIINTCSFIKEAKAESIEMIFELIKLKKQGKIKKILVIGCLPQRYLYELKKELPQLDGLLGVEAWRDIEKTAEKILKGEKIFLARPPKSIYHENLPRLRIGPGHYAYIKISEGCDNRCSYCVIWRIRGKFRSRPIPSIVREIENLSGENSLKEVNLVSQDTTSYGRDLYGKAALVELLREIEKIAGIRWIRLLYTHPAHLTDELIDYMKESKKLCHYLDLPLQHCSDKILKKMRRRVTQSQIRSLISKLRTEIADLAIRTTFIVGFPGETDEDFQQLCRFVEEERFEHVGVFRYSHEEDTSAYRFPAQVPESVKEARYNVLMELQRKISEQILKKFIGKEFEILIDEKQNNLFLGRTQYDAPEVDGEVFLKERHLKIGDFIRAKIVDTYEYDLVGIIS